MEIKKVYNEIKEIRRERRKEKDREKHKELVKMERELTKKLYALLDEM